jgi:ARG and Rhodanese-Phosphatase-superfamily-associated Protein domain
MHPKLYVPILAVAGFAALALLPIRTAEAGEAIATPEYKVLPPIRHGNLTVFPVVAAVTHNTGEFLTLDEGLRSGEVQVAESGSMQPLMRGHVMPAQPGPGAQVNQLMLVNHSKRPLILLAGEIVTGGKQDRVIGKDRIVPAESDPIDLGVFCVEPGRWTGAAAFGVSGGSRVASPMAAPAVRGKAMGDKNQAQVWNEVRSAQAGVAAKLSTSEAVEVTSTTSYAAVMVNPGVTKQVDAVAAPIEHEYRSLIEQLRTQHAVGVVVAVNGKIIWADMFASTDLLEKYWPKLVRSYAAEAFVTQAKDHETDVKAAQAFVDNLEGRHETVESEPGLYRHTEISGDGFRAFELTSLLPKTGFELHVAKMAE